MILYIMRHAEAEAESEALQDEWRFLTEKGRASAKKIGAYIAKCGPRPRLTITSPLTRAVQTAEITTKIASRTNMVVSSERLLPGGDINKLIEYLKCYKDAKRILVVGHEPQLGSLVSALLGRTDEAISLTKGACVSLKLEPGKNNNFASFRWYHALGKKTAMSFKKAFHRK